MVQQTGVSSPGYFIQADAGSRLFVGFPSKILSFSCVSRRWKVLQVAVDERYKLLSGFGKDGSTPGSQAFLASSVEPPWERALTPAKVPYYIK